MSKLVQLKVLKSGYRLLIDRKPVASLFASQSEAMAWLRNKYGSAFKLTARKNPQGDAEVAELGTFYYSVLGGRIPLDAKEAKEAAYRAFFEYQKQYGRLGMSAALKALVLKKLASDLLKHRWKDQVKKNPSQRLQDLPGRKDRVQCSFCHKMKPVSETFVDPAVPGKFLCTECKGKGKSIRKDQTKRKISRRRNISQGFVSPSGFHPIRSAADYDPTRLSRESKEGKKARSAARKHAKAKKLKAGKKTVKKIKAKRAKKNPSGYGRSPGPGFKFFPGSVASGSRSTTSGEFVKYGLKTKSAASALADKLKPYYPGVRFFMDGHLWGVGTGKILKKNPKKTKAKRKRNSTVTPAIKHAKISPAKKALAVLASKLRELTRGDESHGVVGRYEEAAVRAGASWDDVEKLRQKVWGRHAKKGNPSKTKQGKSGTNVGRS